MSQTYEKVCDLAHLDTFTKEIQSALGNSGVLLLRGNLASGDDRLHSIPLLEPEAARVSFFAFSWLAMI